MASLDGTEIKPAEGFLLIRLVDDDLDEDESPRGDYPSPFNNDGLIALIVAVGAKVNAKKGQVAVMRSYARDGVKVGEGLRLVESYCLVGTIAA